MRKSAKNGTNPERRLEERISGGGSGGGGIMHGSSALVNGLMKESILCLILNDIIANSSMIVLSTPLSSPLPFS